MCNALLPSHTHRTAGHHGAGRHGEGHAAQHAPLLSISPASCCSSSSLQLIELAPHQDTARQELSCTSAWLSMALPPQTVPLSCAPAWFRRPSPSHTPPLTHTQTPAAHNRHGPHGATHCTHPSIPPTHTRPASSRQQPPCSITLAHRRARTLKHRRLTRTRGGRLQAQAQGLTQTAR